MSVDPSVTCDGQSGQVSVSPLDLGGGLVIGQAAVFHAYSLPATGSGTTMSQVSVTIAGRPDCISTISLNLPNCPPVSCEVDQITLRVLDSSGADVTPPVEAGDCLQPGLDVVRAGIAPAESTTAFSWRLNGVAATVGCASDGIDLRPCAPPCCPDLTVQSEACLTWYQPSTTTTLTAVGTRIDCAEAFALESGDGTTAETSTPTTTHTYPRFGRFNAAVTIVRPEACGSPRTQRQTVACASDPAKQQA